MAAERHVGIPLAVTDVALESTTASAWVGLVELLVVTWSIELSLPPRFQFAGVPLVWSRLLPVSKVEFTQKLPGTSRQSARATDKSSMTITPVMVPEPPETREQRIFTAPAGTSRDPLRFVNVESSIAAHPSGIGRAGGDKVGFSAD